MKYTMMTLAVGMRSIVPPLSLTAYKGQVGSYTISTYVS